MRLGGRDAAHRRADAPRVPASRSRRIQRAAAAGAARAKHTVAANGIKERETRCYAQLVRSHPSEAKWQADGVGSGYEFGHEFGQIGQLGTLMAPQRSRLLAVSPGCGVGVGVGVGLGLFFFMPLCISSSSRRVRLRKRLQTERGGSTLASTISQQT